MSEITRRKELRIRDSGLSAEDAENGVIDELASEILEGRNIAAGVHDRVRSMECGEESTLAAE